MHMGDALGLESKTVRVVPYDDRWPSLFEAEAKRIRDAVASAGLPTLALEHVGSTAIVGLAAKPILDIAAGYENGIAPAVYIPALESLGYIYRGDGGLPGREFFRRGALRSHHLHLVELGGVHWSRYMRFRDALRADETLRDAYASTKLALAAQYPRDREAYIAGKSEFVESVLRAVEAP
jgi:GrpB-like predicted nucleotidyltransferase (UPF0157 family)